MKEAKRWTWGAVMYVGFMLCYMVAGSVDAGSMSIWAGGALATVGIAMLFVGLHGFIINERE